MSIPADSLGFLLADISRLMRRAYAQQANATAENCLTLAQSRVLVYLSRHQGLRQVELAELLEVQPITLTRQLEPLAQAKLIERRPDARDKRAYLWYLTPAAAPQLEVISQRAEQVKQQALASLSEQQATQLSMSLRQVRNNLSQRSLEVLDDGE